MYAPPHMSSLQNRIDEFLSLSTQFKLGHLVTESPHYLTSELSEWATKDLPRALKAIQAVDALALRVLETESENIWKLHKKIKSVLENGDDVLMVGCGATGRLSLVLEVLSLQMKIYPGRIRAFMAGGDYALIKSVESFEDRTHFGEKQLHELSFKDGDLLIAITEGGETPFVIGACQEAVRISKVKPTFVYCNPNEALESLQRCWEVLSHPHIDKLNLTCGPMALTGSTRMQASTVQMAAVGFALLYKWNSADEMKTAMNQWREWQLNQNLVGLIPFIENEADWHEKKKLVTYVCESELAISLLTDTTERSPTFSQPAFENIQEQGSPSPIYLSVLGTNNSDEAWYKLLGRKPRTLEWPEFNGRIGNSVLKGFDISDQAVLRRSGKTVGFTLLPGRIIWRSETNTWSQPIWDNHPLTTHLALKMAANTLSTLIMGRRGFYLDNVMTWVRPSNNKLIDRATRYVRLLANKRGVETQYEDVVVDVMSEMDKGGEGPVVLRVLKNLTVDLS